MAAENGPLEFDGPANWHCFGFRFVTLTHAGPKEHAEPYAHLCGSENEAFAKFWVQYETFRRGAEQIAWRLRPVLEEQDGKFAVRARVARFPEVPE